MLCQNDSIKVVNENYKNKSINGRVDLYGQLKAGGDNLFYSAM